MEAADPLERAIAIVGLTPLARGLGVTYQALGKWRKKRRLPRTEWTGETRYSETIEQLTGNKVRRDELLAPWPAAAGEQGAA